MNDKKKISTKMSIAIILIVVAIVIGFTLICSNMCSGSEEVKEEFDEVDAWTAAQLEVEENLVSPSTAEFPWGTKGYVTKIDDNTYKINAYVDSENSFGAMVRTHFSCTVRYLGNDKYIVEDLVFWE